MSDDHDKEPARWWIPVAIIIFLVGMMVMGLVSCGGDDDDDSYVGPGRSWFTATDPQTGKELRCIDSAGTFCYELP